MGGDNGVRHIRRNAFVVRVDPELLSDLRILYGIDKRRLKIDGLSFNSWLVNLFNRQVIERDVELKMFKSVAVMVTTLKSE